MTGSVLQLNQSEFDSKVLESPQPVLVDFYADWCQPCRMVAQAVAALAADYEGQAVVGKVNVDDNAELAQRYGISSIPTLLVFKDGQVADRFVGLKSHEELSVAIDRALAGVAS